MSDKRILFISQEIAPYTASSTMSEMGRSLAQDAQSRKFEVRTFMPRYGSINERRNQLHEVIRLSGMNITINDEDHPLILKVASLPPQRIQVYFIDNEDFFQKSATDEDPVGSNRTDNDERAIFFGRCTMETVKKLKWVPKVVVSTGWMSAIAELYMRRMLSAERVLKSVKLVYVITDDKLNAPLDPAICPKLREGNIPAKEVKLYAGLNPDTDMLHTIGIQNADAVVIASPGISEELRKRVEESGKPFITMDPATEPVSKISDFYESLIAPQE